MRNSNQVQFLLSQPVRKVDKVKASFSLDRELFDGFKAICEDRRITQGGLLEAMLEDLIVQAKTLKSSEANARAPVS